MSVIELPEGVASLCTLLAPSRLGEALLLGVQPGRSRSHFGHFSFCVPSKRVMCTVGRSREASESGAFPLTKRARVSHSRRLPTGDKCLQVTFIPSAVWESAGLESKSCSSTCLSCDLRPLASVSLSGKWGQ